MEKEIMYEEYEQIESEMNERIEVAKYVAHYVLKNHSYLETKYS